MNPSIVIIDYGMGNLRNVQKGFERVGFAAKVTRNKNEIRKASAIVLPGVGAFKDCMENLERFGLIDLLLTSIEKGKPYLGICLGFQILFSESEEFGSHKGLGVIKGKVVRFNPDPEHKVPHMGWNTVNIVNRPPILSDIEENSYFYFVHSFYVVPEDRGIIATTTDYGTTFTSMVWKDNVFATQFHPEKSQGLGLKILKGFGDFVRKN